MKTFDDSDDEDDDLDDEEDESDDEDYEPDDEVYASGTDPYSSEKPCAAWWHAIMKFAIDMLSPDEEPGAGQALEPMRRVPGLARTASREKGPRGGNMGR